MFVEALEYPFEGEDTLRTFLVGGTLYLLSPFVLPLVVLAGYSVAVVRDVASDRSGPPPFDDLEAFAGDGLSVVAISLVYLLPGFVLAGFVVGAYASVVAVTGSGDPGVGLALVSAVGGIAGTAYTLAVAYLLPAAIANFARTGNLGAAWDVDVLRTMVVDGTYATAWSLAAIVVLLAMPVGGALTAILAGFVVFFYGQVVATFLYARGSVDRLDGSTAPQTPTSSPGERTTSGSDDRAADTPIDSDAPAEDTDGTGPADGGDDGDDVSGSDSEEDDASEDEGNELTDVAGVGPATAESLRDAGYETVGDLRSVARGDLAAVDGIGPAKADQIKRDVDG